MKHTEKEKILLGKMDLLNPDIIPEVEFILPSSPQKRLNNSRIIKISIIAAGLFLGLITTINNSTSIIKTPEYTQNIETIEYIDAATMNPNQLWHKKQLIVSINNGE